MKNSCHKVEKASKKGKVYFIGASCAGRDLITVRGCEILQQADVIVYDYLVEKELLKEAKPGAKLISCEGLGKKQRQSNRPGIQEKIAAQLVREASKGRVIARLKNGDPLIFSRTSEEIEALLQKRIEFEIVPGLTAAQVASAYSGIPLTDRRYASSVVFVTGRQATEKENDAIDWQHLSGAGTIVLYMAVKNIARIVDALLAQGKSADTPVAAISHAGRVIQRTLITTLGDLPQGIRKKHIRAPAVFIIGETVRLGKKYDWFTKNKRILFTGTCAKKDYVSGTSIHQPVIAIKPAKNYASFDAQIKKIAQFDWILFTSRHAVEYFFKRLCALSLDARSLHQAKIAVIGASTAARLRDFAINADLVPERESSRGMYEALKKTGVKNLKIFFPQSDISDKELTQKLSRLGAHVITRTAYRTVYPESLPQLDLEAFDEIHFTSPSGVRNFVRRYGMPPKNITLRCIGEVTKEQAKKLGLL